MKRLVVFLSLYWLPTVGFPQTNPSWAERGESLAAILADAEVEPVVLATLHQGVKPGDLNICMARGAENATTLNKLNRPFEFLQEPIASDRGAAIFGVQDAVQQLATAPLLLAYQITDREAVNRWMRYPVDGLVCSAHATWENSFGQVLHGQSGRDQVRGLTHIVLMLAPAASLRSTAPRLSNSPSAFDFPVMPGGVLVGAMPLTLSRGGLLGVLESAGVWMSMGDFRGNGWEDFNPGTSRKSQPQAPSGQRIQIYHNGPQVRIVKGNPSRLEIVSSDAKILSRVEVGGKYFINWSPSRGWIEITEIRLIRLSDRLEAIVHARYLDGAGEEVTFLASRILSVTFPSR